MKVIFVMGISGAGKSHFIKQNFSNYKILDLLDFQKKIWSDWEQPSTEQIWQSYVDLKEELDKCIKEGLDVVVEHTLLKRKRREYYLKDLIEKDIQIEGYFLDISEEEYNKRNKNRSNEYINKQVQEIPTKEEGFNNIYIIKK